MLSITLFAACSEYNFVPEAEPVVVGGEVSTEVYDPDVDSEDTGDETDSGVTQDTATPSENSDPDTAIEDTDLEPSEDPCATTQVVFTGLWDDTDGDGDLEHVNAEVYAKPIFSHLGDSATSVIRGDVSRYDLVITNQCAPIRVYNMFFLVDDVDGQWLYDISDDRIESGELTEYASGVEFSAIETHNLDWANADELHYEWCADGTGSAMCVDMGSAREIGASSTEMYNFDFTATDYAPVGTVYQQMIVMIVWEDVTTGAMIWDYIYDIVDVTVTE